MGSNTGYCVQRLHSVLSNEKCGRRKVGTMNKNLEQIAFDYGLSVETMNKLIQDVFTEVSLLLPSFRDVLTQSIELDGGSSLILHHATYGDLPLSQWLAGSAKESDIRKMVLTGVIVIRNGFEVWNDCEKNRRKH